MINEIYTHAKPSNGKAKMVAITSLAIGALITLAYIISELYKGVIALFAVLAVVVAVYFYTKYIGVEYYYDITFDSAGAPVFVVRQVTGKRQSTLCRLDLHSITKIEKLTSAERKARHAAPGYKKYFYLPTFRPESVILITAISSMERAEITIEASDNFADMLRAYSIEARANRFENEEY